MAGSVGERSSPLSARERRPSRAPSNRALPRPAPALHTPDRGPRECPRSRGRGGEGRASEGSEGERQEKAVAASRHRRAESGTPASHAPRLSTRTHTPHAHGRVQRARAVEERGGKGHARGGARSAGARGNRPPKTHAHALSPLNKKKKLTGVGHRELLGLVGVEPDLCGREEGWGGG